MKKAIILSLALLAGCAPMIWDKPGGSVAEYNKDSYECEKDTRQSGYFGGGIPGAMAMRDFAKRCMVSKGYTLRGDTSPAARAQGEPPTYHEMQPVVASPAPAVPAATQTKTVGTYNKPGAAAGAPLDIAKADDLKPGVSTIGSAVDLFGVPSSETNFEDKSKLLLWSRPIPNAAQLAILFDASGKMVRVTHKSFY